MLGIAVTTYNRAHLVGPLIEAIRSNTSCPYALVICDDGSKDGVADVAKAYGVPCIGNKNRGIAWNKNRGLFYLRNVVCADKIILLDDDLIPNKHGWEREIVSALDIYGHVNIWYDHQPPLWGACTAADIGVGDYLGGGCMGFTTEILAFLGYMDTRFGRYGYEHVDLTRRCVRLGYGGFMEMVGDDLKEYFYIVDCGLRLILSPSHSDEDSIRQNAEIMIRSMKEPIYRPPWRDEVEFQAMQEEMQPYIRGPAQPVLAHSGHNSR